MGDPSPPGTYPPITPALSGLHGRCGYHEPDSDQLRVFLAARLINSYAAQANRDVHGAKAVDLDQLAVLRVLSQEVDSSLRVAMRDCRARGASWAEIGTAWVTKQSAHERFSQGAQTERPHWSPPPVGHLTQAGPDRSTGD